MDHVLLHDRRVDLASRRVVHPTGEERLTPKETALLAYLVSRPSRVIPREELMSEVWGYAHNTRSRTLDTTVHTLRAKLEVHRATPRYLLTEPSIGYRFEPLNRPAVSRNGLVGREALSAMLREQVATPGITTLVGAPGVGKSALAVDVFEEAQAVGLAEVGPEGLAARLEALAQPFASGQPLLLQDADRVVTELADWLQRHRSDQSRAMVTCREGLRRPWERRVSVPPLDVVDGVVLLARRARSQGMDVDGEEVHLSSLVQAVGGVPLLIEALVPSLELYGAEGLEARLEGVLDRVVEVEGARLDRTPQDGPTRCALVHLGLVGTVELAMAEAMLEGVVDDGVGMVRQLLQRGFLSRLPRTTQVSVVPMFARQARHRASPEERLTAQTHLAEALLTRLEPLIGGTERLDDSNWVLLCVASSGCVPGLAAPTRAAFEHAVATNQGLLAARLLRVAVSGVTGEVAERLALTARALDIVEGMPPEARLLCEVAHGATLLYDGRHDEAKDVLEGVMARCIDRPRRWRECIDPLGCALRLLGRLEEAQAIYVEGLACSDGDAWPLLRAEMLRGLGRVHQILAEVESGVDAARIVDARRCLREAAALYRQCGADYGLVTALIVGAKLEYLAGDQHRAEGLLSEAATLARSQNMARAWCTAEMELGSCLMELGRPAEGLERAETAIRLAEQAGATITEWAATAWASIIAADADDTERARAYLDAAQRGYTPEFGDVNELFLQWASVVVLAAQGDAGRTTWAVHTLVQRWDADKPHLWGALAWSAAALVAHRAGLPDEARASLRRAERLSRPGDASMALVRGLVDGRSELVEEARIQLVERDAHVSVRPLVRVLLKHAQALTNSSTPS